MFKNRAPSTLYIRLRPIAWASAFVAQALLTTSPSTSEKEHNEKEREGEIERGRGSTGLEHVMK